MEIKKAFTEIVFNRSRFFIRLDKYCFWKYSFVRNCLKTVVFVFRIISDVVRSVKRAHAAALYASGYIQQAASLLRKAAAREEVFLWQRQFWMQ